jgi:hypothetical protein
VKDAWNVLCTLLQSNRTAHSRRRKTVADVMPPIIATSQKLMFFVLVQHFGCDWHVVKDAWNVLCTPDVSYIRNKR